MGLNEAKKNYQKIKAIDAKYSKNVRKPCVEELPENN